MIDFKSCKWKNFLSTGNDFTKIQLNRSPTTLIVGANGAGKSTLLDAISFGLFGKPHRDIKKDQMINSINKKGTVVEVEFNVGGQEFRVHRSIKPNKFEIYQNGHQINQASNARDHQKFLEQNILKLNHKSFHQVVVLGSSSFIPFMQLPAWTRREVIEDLLDINIFSKMNGLLRERNTKIKEEIVDITHHLELLKTKQTAQTKYIKDLQGINKDMIDQKHESIITHKNDIAAFFEESRELGKKLTTEMKAAQAANNKHSEAISQLNAKDYQTQSQIKELVQEARFYEENDNCPTCDQVIDQAKKDQKLSELSEKASGMQKGMDILKKELQASEHDLQVTKDQMAKLQERQTKINSNNDAVALLQKEIDKIQSEINTLSSQSGDVKAAKKDLEKLRKDKDKSTERKLEYVEERTYNEVIGEMLKDTGIKTKVIKQYLPVMNRLINNYLQVLDFFVAFHLDESFNETIRSRHRDTFNYASFSEGEKQRIDLALLFTWRQIAKMKNSASSNLLILDETFDSSLDVDGIDNLTKILNTLEEGTNVFIISHKGDILENKFRNKIEFYKDRNFSKIK
jgi:DNA repair exonuclease SbcCD ATPase subunit